MMFLGKPTNFNFKFNITGPHALHSEELGRLLKQAGADVQMRFFYKLELERR
ncbi:hypothetical protein SLEP1_g59900 [Rubroshorea leprosula]|uniref:Uncharacterized protein n=1 Tax=Rubroshorea leprosula TaxID=152421 RepID=A0AAV5MTP1_9ROSI|nr:hypothetical protein SLEP1_g59900 [Rubroshorea leprosula]